MQSLLYILLLGLMSLTHRAFAAPLAVQGGADLSVVDWQQEPIVELRGGWQFYWQQLLTPADLEAGRGKLSAYISPESEWHKTSIPGHDLQRIGSATYHLRLYVEESKELTLVLPILNSASRVWINGELRQDFGQLSLNGEGERGYIRANRHRFQARQGENQLTIQVSNHLFWYGGASLPVRIGLPAAVEKQYIRAMVEDAFSIGFILFMAIYHIFVRFLLKRSSGALYFGFSSLAIALRLGFIGDGQIFYHLWPGISLQLHYFVEYLAVASGTGCILLFYRELYPNEAPRILFNPFIYVSFAWAGFIVLAPARYFPGFLEIFQLVILFSGVVTITTAIRAARHGRDGANLLVGCNLLFYCTVVNDVTYHHRVIQTIPLVQYGLMIMMASQAFILAKRFGRAFDRAEKAEQEVTKLNHGLEQKIMERTEQINTILNHVSSGFLLVDRDARLQTGFTSSCETILGRKLQVGSSLPAQLDFAPRLDRQFTLALQQIFDSDLPTEVAMLQLPARFPMGERMIGLQVAAVKSRDRNLTTAVLLTINDVTDLVAAEEGLRRADILIHILEDQDAFRIFLTDFKKDLEAAIQAIASADAHALHSILHTMKGNAASFNLADWVERLHRLEEKEPIEIDDIRQVSEHVRQFLKQNEGILHLDFDQPLRSVFEVDQRDLNQLRESLIPVVSPVALDRVETWSRTVQALPLKSYTAPLGPMVSRVADQLQKRVCLVVEGGDLKVDHAFAKVLTTLPHLIRNALVHGIEEPDDRGTKTDMATITLRFAPQSDGGLRIEVSDDGRGLDVKRIEAQAREQGLLNQQSQLSEAEAWAMIFHPNFSTADKVTDLAGRGIGLAAVAAAVQELGGRYEVKSQKGQGFQVIMDLPAVDRTRLERAS